MDNIRTLADFFIVLIILPGMAFMVGKLFSIESRVVRLETKIDFLVHGRIQDKVNHESSP